MPQPLLSGEVEAEYINEVEPVGVAELRERVAALEVLYPRIKRDVVLALLQLLSDSLRHVASGKFDISVISTPSAEESKWEAVKQRLQPRHREVIDVLLVQKAMTRKQISAAIKMNYTNCVNNVIGPMIRQGWLVDNGREIVLKEL